MDYVPWLPGRQGPRFIPIAIVVGAILLCSFCAFCAGVVTGIELPGIIAPTPPDNNSPSDTPQDEPTPESFMWQVVYSQT